MEILKKLKLIKLSKYVSLEKKKNNVIAILRDLSTRQHADIEKLEKELRKIRSKSQEMKKLATQWHNEYNNCELKFRDLQNKTFQQTISYKKSKKSSERYRWKLRRTLQYLEDLKLKENRFEFIYRKVKEIKERKKKL